MTARRDQIQQRAHALRIAADDRFEAALRRYRELEVTVEEWETILSMPWATAEPKKRKPVPIRQVLTVKPKRRTLAAMTRTRDQGAETRPAVDIERIGKRIDALMAGAEKAELKSRIEIGDEFIQARRGIATSGPKAAEWSKFCDARNVSKDTAGRYMAVAQFVAEHPDARDWALMRIYEQLGIHEAGWGRAKQGDLPPRGGESKHTAANSGPVPTATPSLFNTPGRPPTDTDGSLLDPPDRPQPIPATVPAKPPERPPAPRAAPVRVSTAERQEAPVDDVPEVKREAPIESMTTAPEIDSIEHLDERLEKLRLAYLGQAQMWPPQRERIARHLEQTAQEVREGRRP